MKHGDIQKLHDAGLCAASLFLLAILVFGCKTANVSAPLASHPESYRRVAILPVCIDSPYPSSSAAMSGASETDRRQAGIQLVFALTNQLARKGYEVVGPVRVLCGENDWSKLDLTASWILRQQFDLERIRSDCGETNGLYTCGFIGSLPMLREKLGLPEADAVVLIERWLDFPPPIKPMPRAAENGALALMGILAVSGGDFELLAKTLDSDQRNEVLYGSAARPAAQAPPWIYYSLYIFDSRTQEVIYSTHRSFTFKNPARAVRFLLGPLPKARQ